MFIILFILILFFILYYNKYETFNNDENLKDSLAKLYGLDTLFDRDNISIIKPKDTSEIIVKNFVKLNKIKSFLILRNLKYTNKQISESAIQTNEKPIPPDYNLLYLNNPLDHLYNTYSGYLISNSIKTVNLNKNYGFLFTYNENKESNLYNHAEISIDFNKNQKKNIKICRKNY